MQRADPDYERRGTARSIGSGLDQFSNERIQSVCLCPVQPSFRQMFAQQPAKASQAIETSEMAEQSPDPGLIGSDDGLA